MFDLETAIATWHDLLKRKRVFTVDDLEELECHLRDYIAAQVHSGIDEATAFHTALRRMGDSVLIEDEYRKMYWRKVRHRGRMWDAFYGELSMLKNYLKIATRNLVRHKGYAFINIAGLALGMATCLLILLFVKDELSFDRHHTHADHIYRVTREWFNESDVSMMRLSQISLPLGPALEDAFPEIEQMVRISQSGGVVSYENQIFEEPRFFFADPTLFDVFSISLVQGNPETALEAPNQVIITEAVAQKYFGDADPMGRVLRVFSEVDLQVTGVMTSQPANSHVHFDFIASLETARPFFAPEQETNWHSFNNYATYLLVTEGTDPVRLEARIGEFLTQHMPPADNNRNVLHLQALRDIHLYSHTDNEFEPNGDVTYVYLFSIIALFVLLIACFNFMNLSTARSSNRTREVGMRKVLGAQRGQLIGQFLGESILLTILGLVVAVAVVLLVLPYFNALSGKSVALGLDDISWLLPGLLGMALLIGLLSGSYPALFLSRFRPLVVLKGAVGGAWRSRFRTTLVVIQFTITIVLLIGMGVVVRQMDYVQNKRLGFEADHLVVLPATSEMRRDFERIRQQLLASPYVRSVTASRLVPSGALVDHIGVSAEVGGAFQPFSIPLNPVDHEFLDTYGMNLVAGRTFAKDRASDSTEAFILNETAVRTIGWETPEAAIGRRFVLEGNSGFRRPGQVIGVVEDFHFESLHEQISPLVMFIMPQRYQRVTVKISGDDVPAALDFLDERWQTYRPNTPFTYYFIDDTFGALYAAEERLGQMFGLFAGLAALIACLGLFGLASFMAEQRRKEIGVRKVLGASASGIVGLMAKEFAILIGIAAVLALPIAYLIMQRWLESFAYRTNVGWTPFLIAGGSTLLIALLTVSYQSVRAALANPVESLRYE